MFQRQEQTARVSDTGGSDAAAMRAAGDAGWTPGGTSSRTPNWTPVGLVTVVWAGRYLIAAITALALIGMLVFLAFTTPQYVATAQILIDPTDLRVIENTVTPANQLNDTVLLKVESQLRVIGSGNVLMRVVENLRLYEDPDFGGGKPSGLRAILSNMLSSGSATQPSDEARKLAALDQLRKRLKLNRADRTYVVDISATTRNAARSAAVANAVAHSYLEEQKAARVQNTRRAMGQITSRLDDLRRRVQEAEERVEAYKAQNNITVSSGQLVNEQQLSDLNNQIGLARVKVAEAKARMEEARKMSGSLGESGAFAEAIQSPTITALRSQYAEMVRTATAQASLLGPRHPTIVALQAQAQGIRRAIDDELQRIMRAAENEYNRARDNEASLTATLEGLRQKSVATSKAMVPLRELEREAAANRAVYEAFLTRSRETSEQELVDTQNVRIISEAEPPLHKSWPPSRLLMLAALFLGMGLGTTVVVGREYLPALLAGGEGAVIENPPRVEAPAPVVPAPVSAPVSPPVSPPAAASPDTSKSLKALVSGIGASWKQRMEKVGVAANAGKQPWNVSSVQRVTGAPLLAVVPDPGPTRILHTLDDFRSPFAAGLREAASQLLPEAARPQKSRILVLGGEDGQAAATVGLNLASVLAARQKVLLVDADLERQTAAGLLMAGGHGGLMDVASGRQSLADVMTHDSRTRISVLALMSAASAVDDQVSDADIRAAFEQTADFDVVVVVAPNRGDDPGTRFFAEIVDQIVLVLSPDRVMKDDIDRLRTTLGDAAGKIRGSVLLTRDTV